jgi:MFS family permease
LKIKKQSENQSNEPGVFYGYYVVIAAFITLTLGWGVYYSYGVFFKPLMQEFGWTTAITSGAFSASIFISGSSGIVAGRLSDRLGPRVVIIFCTILLSSGYILMSVVQSTWQFYLVYALLIAPGIAGFWAPPVSTIARWFHGRRGLMTGIVSGGISFGQFILPPLLTGSILSYNWRATYVAIGVITLIAVGISAQFIRSSPQQMGLKPYGHLVEKPSHNIKSSGFTLRQAIQTRQFWMACLIYFCFGIAQLAVMVHMVPHATDMGISPIQASIILSIIGVVSFIGRVSIGTIVDTAPIKKTTNVCLLLMVVALTWLMFSNDLWKLYLFAVFFGFSYGGLSCIQSLMAAELFGLGILGVVTAIFSFSFSFGGSIGPLMAGFIVDFSNNYQWVFLTCLIIVTMALVISLALKPPARKTLNSK